MIGHQKRTRAFSKPDAAKLRRHCLRQKGVVLVIDNTFCLCDLKAVLLEEEFNQPQLLKLSPYSPMLNGVCMDSFQSLVPAINVYNGARYVVHIQRFISDPLNTVAIEILISFYYTALN